MLIAVMSNRADTDGTVPDTFENAFALLFWETDRNAVVETYAGKTPEEYASLIADSEAEAVVCGKHIEKACFDPIADAGISRYDGVGLKIEAAANGALRNTLPMIPEYEGSPGCVSGMGACREHD